jgi:hypothetical protein
VSLPIINQPNAVLRHLAPESGLYDADYIAERKKRMRALASPLARVMCHHADANMIEIFPEWMADAGPHLLKHGRIRDRMSKNPLLAVQMLLSSYDETQPLLERAVLSSGEATVPLLCAIDDGRIRPRAGREVYEHPLLDQPWWGMRYLATSNPGREAEATRVKFMRKLTKQCAELQNTSPQAALVHLLLNPDIDPSAYADTLCREAMVAYVASRLLAVRGLNLRLDQVATLDPRWASHIALWGAFSGGNVDPRVEDAIAGHAAWAGEYIAHNEARHKDWTWVKAIYDRVDQCYKSRSNTEPDLWADLLWAMLDRICLQVEGKNPRITFAESYSRNSTPTPAAEAVSTTSNAQN